MNVSDIMTGRPVTIKATKSVIDARQLMEEVGCHHLPVISAEGHLIGIISDRDCQRASAASHETAPIYQYMSPAPIVIEPDAPAPEAARLMLKHYIGCLPVMLSETLVGIVTTSDILIAFMQEHRNDGRQTELIHSNHT